MADLRTPLIDVLGARSAKTLAAELELRTVGDLLSHYPRDYYKQGDPSSLETLVEGEYLTFHAVVLSSKWIPASGGGRQYGKGRGLRGRAVVNLSLPKGSIEAVFWNQQWIPTQMPPGTAGIFTGKVGTFRGKYQLNSPRAEKFIDPTSGVQTSDGGELTLLDLSKWVDRLLPIYPGTSVVESSAIARSVDLVLDALVPLEDPLTSAERAEYDFIDFDSALRLKHRPKDRAELAKADRRLKFDEALVLQLALSRGRHETTLLPAIARPRPSESILDEFDRDLPFELTPGQRSAAAAIEQEIATEHPMHRLLQGDVGSGKTVVALRAMLQVAATGGQSALLAPTDVLAHQHARSIRNLLGPLGNAGELGSHPDAVKIVVLSASLSAAARKSAMLDIASGAATIVVGTHALLEPKVQFADLGFVVVDEQHRFGVEQRDALRQKGRGLTMPHTLVMTATPIPRTIAITAFGELEALEMKDLPAGRLPVATTVIPAMEKWPWLKRAWERIVEEVSAGRQAYVVCPRIGDDDDPEDAMRSVTGGSPLDYPAPAQPGDEEKRRAVSVMEAYESLTAGPLHGLRVSILHGRMPGDEKDAIMRDYAAGKIDVLVSTTVIEVGVDVPNATVMVVLDAERFGLATLHQLRGRVGRGRDVSVCLLVTAAAQQSQMFERLSVLQETNDGFEIAERDLEYRREGDVLGVDQSGTRSRLRLLSLQTDYDIIKMARDYSDQVIEQDPALNSRPTLKDALDAVMDDDSTAYLHKG